MALNGVYHSSLTFFNYPKTLINPVKHDICH
jgi:hypothetical protein